MSDEQEGGQTSFIAQKISEDHPLPTHFSESQTQRAPKQKIRRHKETGEDLTPSFLFQRSKKLVPLSLGIRPYKRSAKTQLLLFFLSSRTRS